VGLGAYLFLRNPGPRVAPTASGFVVYGAF
jgi:hypothetical protein